MATEDQSDRPTADRPTADLPTATAVLRRGIQQGNHLGAQLWVAHRGDVVGDVALGSARAGVAMTQDSVIAWQCAGKPFTSVAIAQLWERGLLSPHQKVAEHLVELRGTPPGEVTIADLLTHTSGLRDYVLPVGRSSSNLLSNLSMARNTPATRALPLATGTGQAPSGGALYSVFTNWFVLGQIIERITGWRVARYIEDSVFRPAGLHDSYVGVPPEDFALLEPRLALTHLARDGAIAPVPWIDSKAVVCAGWPGVGLRGPIRELGAFYLALSNLWKNHPRPGGPSASAGDGGALVQGTTLRRVLEPVHRGTWYGEKWLSHRTWGLGFIVGGVGFAPCASDSSFGHNGSQTVFGFADPEADLVVAFGANGIPGWRVAEPRRIELVTAIYADLGIRSSGPSPEWMEREVRRPVLF